jgi:hypothetical protein
MKKRRITYSLIFHFREVRDNYVMLLKSTGEVETRAFPKKHEQMRQTPARVHR